MVVECDVERPTITRASVTPSLRLPNIFCVRSFVPRMFVRSILLPEKVVDPRVQMIALNTCEICHCFFPLWFRELNVFENFVSNYIQKYIKISTTKLNKKWNQRKTKAHKKINLNAKRKTCLIFIRSHCIEFYLYFHIYLYIFSIRYKWNVYFLNKWFILNIRWLLTWLILHRNNINIKMIKREKKSADKKSNLRIQRLLGKSSTHCATGLVDICLIFSVHTPLGIF